MNSLIFRYRVSMLVVMSVGFPLLGTMAVLFAYLPLYLMRRTDLGIGMKFDVMLCGALGVFFLWIFLAAARCWRSYFSIYTVDINGIRVRFFSSETFLGWNQLSSARYRRALGQIELRFVGFPYLVVLNNVDMNSQRKTVRAALGLIENILPNRVAQTWM